MENIRQSYRPEKVNVLFVGESAPAAGTFFYLGDILAKYTKEAFSRAYKVNFNDSKEFLIKFKKNNFFLDDLCLFPVNNFNHNRKIEARRNSVLSLSDRIRGYSPKAIICIMLAINKYVKNAVKLADINNIIFYSLPFPSHGHQSKYIEKLTETLEELKTAGIIKTRFI